MSVSKRTAKSAKPKQKGKPKKRPDKGVDNLIDVGVIANLSVIIPIKIQANKKKLKAATVGEFEGVPIVSGEEYQEAGDAARAAFIKEEKIFELVGEFMLRTKVYYPKYKEIKYLINESMVLGKY